MKDLSKLIQVNLDKNKWVGFRVGLNWFIRFIWQHRSSLIIVARRVSVPEILRVVFDVLGVSKQVEQKRKK